MEAPVFPIFTLKVKNNLVIAGGGGGDKKFGKANGVIVLDRVSMRDMGYYETSDIVVDICVYDPVEDVEEIDSDDMSWDEYDSETSDRQCEEGCAEGEGGSDGTGDVDAGSGEAAETSGGETGQRLYLACSGEEYFYLLRYECTRLVLMKKIEKRIDSQVFAKDLYVISDRTLFGFHNVIETPDTLDDILRPERRRRKINSTLLGDESHEEYIYRLSKKKNRIVFKREEGRSDILNNWENFFLTPGMVHKVVLEDGKSTFVYNSKKYSHNRKVGRIVCKGGALVYYLKGRDSAIYFQTEYEKSYSIPKITTMSWDGEYVTVGTGDGYVYLFHENMLRRRRRVCNVPVTGVGFAEGYVYFSTVGGLIDRRDILGGSWTPYVMLALIVLVAAILAAVFFGKRT